MAHAQKPDFVFRRNGRVYLNWRGRQFSRLLAAEVCASAVIMLDTPCSEVVWRVVATHSIRRFPLHFPSRASPCAITFQLESTFLWFSRKPLGLQETCIERAMCFFLLWNRCSKSTALRQVRSELRWNWPICIHSEACLHLAIKLGSVRLSDDPFSGYRVAM